MMRINLLSIGAWLFALLLGAVMPTLHRDYPTTFKFCLFIAALMVIIGFMNLKVSWGSLFEPGLIVVFVCIAVILLGGACLCVIADKKDLATTRRPLTVKVPVTTDKKIHHIVLQSKKLISGPIVVDALVSRLGEDYAALSLSKGRSRDDAGILSGENTYSFNPPLDIPSKHSFIAIFVRGKGVPGGVTACVAATTTYGESDWFAPLNSVAALDQSNKDHKPDQTQITSFVNSRLNGYVESFTFGKSKDRFFLDY